MQAHEDQCTHLRAIVAQLRQDVKNKAAAIETLQRKLDTAYALAERQAHQLESLERELAGYKEWAALPG